jgi:H+/Cl- antiporter ClcA
MTEQETKPLIRETIVYVKEADEEAHQSTNDFCLGFCLGFFLCIPGAFFIICVKKKKEYLKGWAVPATILTLLFIGYILFGRG